MTIAVDLQFIGNGKRIVQPEGGEQQDSVRETLLTAIARGQRWQAHIDEGTVSGIREIAKRIGRNESYVARIMRLSLMAPGIIRSIIAGDYPPDLTINRVRRALPILWKEQEEMLLK